jgi:hypothetical protein
MCGDVMTSWKMVCIEKELHERILKAKGDKSFGIFIKENLVFPEAQPVQTETPVIPNENNTGL